MQQWSSHVYKILILLAFSSWGLQTQATQSNLMLAEADDGFGEVEEEAAGGGSFGEEEGGSSSGSGGKVKSAQPKKACMSSGGEFVSSVRVDDIGEGAYCMKFTSVNISGPGIVTGREFRVVPVTTKRRTLPYSQLKARTPNIVVKTSHPYIRLKPGRSVTVKVFPGESVALVDKMMRNFQGRVCVQIDEMSLSEEKDCKF